MIKNFFYNYFVSRKISFKLMFLTILFSAFITLFITILQLYMDYRNGIKEINNQFSLVESGYKASLEQSVWVFDKEQALLQLDSILNLPDIEYAKIKLLDSDYLERGKETNSTFVTKQMILTYLHNAKEITLGELVVVADLSRLYQQLIDKTIVILFSQAIKTFLTSFFILFLFQILVTRHLEQIARFTKKLRVDTKPEHLSLKKLSSDSTRDELDNLTEAINVMQDEIYKSFLNVSSELKARKIAEQSLLEYKKAFDESAYVSKSNLDGKITYVNDALCQITGYTREELIGKSHSIFRSKRTPTSLFDNMWETIKNKKSWKGNLEDIKKDGTSFYVYSTIIPILDSNGETIEYIASRYDITELVEKRKTLEEYYETDMLTKLGNRFKLLNDIQSSNKPALAIIDIDSFKEINDFYGHEIGDNVIVEFSKRLDEFISDQFTEVYRLQADQFAFLYREFSSKESFESKMQELIIELTNKPIFFEQHEILLGVSVGISFEKKELFINADIALKMAKQSKKNYVTYTKDFNIEQEYENNLIWSKKIKKALDEDRIVAFFQPIYNKRTKKIEKFEALVRMIEPDGVIISPFLFLEISKKAKLYPKITMLMIDKTIKAALSHEYVISLNITIEDILNQEVNKYLIQSIQESGVGKKIVIELVESEGIENFEEVYSFIKQVKLLGCKLAIDDFGTGYSNFEYLLKLDIDYIKIDGSLVKELDKNEHMRLIAKTIVAFAKTAKMKTIAEFVSHKEIMEIVEEIGVDYIQGYYIGKPVPYDEISSFKNISL